MKLKKLHKSTNLDLYSANTETSLEIPLVKGVKVYRGLQLLNGINRFYLEDYFIGKYYPLFNIDIER